MLETNEKYMSQKKLNTLLSTTPPKYKPTKKELETVVIFDTAFLYSLWSYLYIISLINDILSLDKDNNINDVRKLLGRLNEKSHEIESMIGKTPKKNPNLRDLTMADFKSSLFDIQYQLKEIKKYGQQEWYIKKYLDKFSEYYKAIQEPIICED